MPLPLPVARFNHATLNCRDTAESVGFYTRVLGFAPAPRPGFDFAGAWLYQPGLGMTLHLIEDRGFDPPRGAISSRRSHLAFRVEDFDAAIERLAALGVESLQKRLPDLGYRQAFFLDPSGNVLEVGEWPDPDEMFARMAAAGL